MGSLQDILKKAQKMLFCPVCKRSYQLNEIRLKGVLDSTYIFQTVCNKHQAPVVTVFVAHHETKPGQRLEIVRKVDNGKVISLDEVINMHEALSNFDGNFESAFRK